MVGVAGAEIVFFSATAIELNDVPPSIVSENLKIYFNENLKC